MNVRNRSPRQRPASYTNHCASKRQSQNAAIPASSARLSAEGPSSAPAYRNDPAPAIVTPSPTKNVCTKNTCRVNNETEASSLRHAGWDETSELLQATAATRPPPPACRSPPPG